MRLNTVEFLLTQAWTAIVRNGVISGATVTNIAVALCVLGAFALTALNLEHLARGQAEAVAITVDLAKNAPAAQVEQALLADPGVRSARFVGKDQALEDLSRRWGLDLGALKRIGNPLADAYRVTPADPNQVEQVAQRAQQIPGVQEARYAQQTTRKLLAVARGIKLTGLVAVIVLGTATLLLVSVTIRLTIYARRREIRIMQLVGATNWFIRVPFLLEGVFQGAVGAVVAVVLLLPGYSYLQGIVAQNLSFLQLVYSVPFLVLLSVGLLLTGILFGAAGSLLGLQLHLREV